MRKLKKAVALCLSLLALLTMPVKASAAELREEIIDTGRTGSLTIYKYDITSSEKDGVWDSSYVSTGVFDQTVNDTLGAGGKENIQGNGQTSYGYAIAGVEFSYIQYFAAVLYQRSQREPDPDKIGISPHRSGAERQQAAYDHEPGCGGFAAGVSWQQCG